MRSRTGRLLAGICVGVCAASALLAQGTRALQDRERPTAEGASGSRLTMREIERVRQAVLPCWNIGALSDDARMVRVTVGVTMMADGRPDPAAITLLGSSAGPPAQVEQVFQSARRAILRCGVGGYDLPSDKFAQWRNIEITFDPSRMQ